MAEVKILSYALGLFVGADSAEGLAHSIDDFLTAVAENCVCLFVSTHDEVDMLLELAVDLIRVLFVMQSMDEVIHKRLDLCRDLVPSLLIFVP